MFVDFVFGIVVMVLMMYAAVFYPVFFWVTVVGYFGIDVYDGIRMRSGVLR